MKWCLSSVFRSCKNYLTDFYEICTNMAYITGSDISLHPFQDDSTFSGIIKSKKYKLLIKYNTI